MESNALETFRRSSRSHTAKLNLQTMPQIRSNRQLPHLPEAARAYLDALPGEPTLIDLSPLDRTGIAVWDAHVVLDRPETLPGIVPSGFGYGEDPAEGIVGALGECCETAWPSIAANDRRASGKDYVRASYDELVRVHGERAVADPLTLCPPAGSPVGRSTALLWDEAERLATGETVLVPCDVAASDNACLPADYAPFTTLISNGLGAGPTRDWAVAHGLGEILQRDGNGLLFRALDSGVAIELDETADPAVLSLRDRLAAAGIKVLPKFATDEFGLANVFVVGFDDGPSPTVPIMASAGGEACDADRDRALRKAMLEFASSRVRKAFAHGPLDVVDRIAPPGYLDEVRARPMEELIGDDDRALSAMQDWSNLSEPELKAALASSVHAVRSRRPLASLPAMPGASPEARQRRLFEAMAAAGIDVLYVDGSPPGHPVHAVKVIAPTLEVETMSYARIGERNARKLIEADSPMIRFGEPTAERRPVRLTEAALARLGGRQPLFDLAEARRIVGTLYPLYREPEAHVVGLLAERRRG